MKRKKYIFCILKVTENFGTDLHPDPLVRATDPRIRTWTKMSMIRNTADLLVQNSVLKAEIERNNLDKDLEIWIRIQ